MTQKPSLSRVLEDQAREAVPDSLNLWPAVAARLEPPHRASRLRGLLPLAAALLVIALGGAVLALLERANSAAPYTAALQATATATPTPISQPPTNAEIVRRFFEQGWGQGDLDAAAALITSDYRQRLNNEPPPQAVTAIMDPTELISSLHVVVPDLEVVVGETITEGDAVAARVTLRGTHTGRAEGYPEPTGNTILIEMVVTAHLRDGRIADLWATFDTLEPVIQFGIIPPEMVEEIERRGEAEQAADTPPHADLPPGMVAITLPLDLLGFDSVIQVEDRVVVVGAFMYVDAEADAQFQLLDAEGQAGFAEGETPRLLLQEIVRDAIVLHIGGSPAAPDSTPTPTPAWGLRPVIVTLAVSPDDAQVLTWMAESQMPLLLVRVGDAP